MEVDNNPVVFCSLCFELIFIYGEKPKLRRTHVVCRCSQQITVCVFIYLTTLKK